MVKSSIVSALSLFLAFLSTSLLELSAQGVFEASKDPGRDRSYVKIEAEDARLITRADKTHPAFDPKDLEGPSLHYQVLGEDSRPSIEILKAASGGKALVNTGTGEQTASEARRNGIYLPHEQPPLGTVAEYRVRFREAGVYELFLRLAYRKIPNRELLAHWAAPANATGTGAIHVKDFDKGRPLNSNWWRRHNNAAWDLSTDLWKVVDFGPALEVLASDLNDEGYVDVVWQISASHPGLLIDSFVLYRGYSIDPSVSKFAQKEPFDALPLSKLHE